MPNDQTKIDPNLFGHPVKGPLFCAIAFSPSNAIANTLKGPFREGPPFSKVSFRKKRTLNGVLYLNWLSESILENSFQARKYFMREFLILVLKVKSHSYFSLFCGLHLTVIADDFKGLFFLPTFGLEWKREPLSYSWHQSFSPLSHI